MTLLTSIVLSVAVVIIVLLSVVMRLLKDIKDILNKTHKHITRPRKPMG